MAIFIINDMECWIHEDFITDTNPLSKHGLELASQAAMKRINDHLDMRVREWEADCDRDEFFRYFERYGMLMQKQRYYPVSETREDIIRLNHEFLNQKYIIGIDPYTK